MKTKILSVLILSHLAFASSSHAESWYCEADCGGVKHVLSFAYEGLVPVYAGEIVYGEGETMGSAFSDMKKNCKAILHDGFLARTFHYIRINTAVSPSKVCRKL